MVRSAAFGFIGFSCCRCTWADRDAASADCTQTWKEDSLETGVPYIEQTAIEENLHIRIARLNMPTVVREYV